MDVGTVPIAVNGRCLTSPEGDATCRVAPGRERAEKPFADLLAPKEAHGQPVPDKNKGTSVLTWRSNGQKAVKVPAECRKLLAQLGGQKIRTTTAAGRLRLEVVMAGQRAKKQEVKSNPTDSLGEVVPQELELAAHLVPKCVAVPAHAAVGEKKGLMGDPPATGAKAAATAGKAYPGEGAAAHKVVLAGSNGVGLSLPEEDPLKVVTGAGQRVEGKPSLVPVGRTDGRPPEAVVSTPAFVGHHATERGKGCPAQMHVVKETGAVQVPVTSPIQAGVPAADRTAAKTLLGSGVVDRQDVDVRTPLGSEQPVGSVGSNKLPTAVPESPENGGQSEAKLEMLQVVGKGERQIMLNSRANPRLELATASTRISHETRAGRNANAETRNRTDTSVPEGTSLGTHSGERAVGSLGHSNLGFASDLEPRISDFPFSSGSGDAKSGLDGTLPRIAIHSEVPVRMEGAQAKGLVQDVGQQILDSVHASVARGGDRQVLLRLHPPELGTVVIRFQEDGARIGATLEVSRSETRHEIEQALPQVVRGLQDAGVQIRRFDVVSSDQPDRDFTRGQFQEEAWAQQQGSGREREHMPSSSDSHWTRDGEARATTQADGSMAGSPPAPASDRIDVLL